MALITCPECGKQVSDRAASCPNCGYPINSQVATSSSNTPVNQEEEEDNNVYTKCPTCGQVYYDDPNDVADLTDVSRKCQCGTDIEISFFGYCPCCEHATGFRPASWGSIAKSTVSNFLDGMLNPLETLGGLIDDATDDIPAAKATGTCQFCNNAGMLCPNCNVTFLIEPDDGFDTKWECPNCGIQMRQA